MVNKNKVKGSRWEADLVKLLEPQAEYVKRIPGSGAIGTSLKETRLTGDVKLKYKFLPKEFKIEAKTGYGGATSMTIQRGWMSKVREEAKNNGSYPAVSFKFKDVMAGDRESAKWMCMSIEDWNSMMSYLNELFLDLDDYWKWKYAKETVGPNDKVGAISSNNKKQVNE
jgi:Holliday junction resolvase